MFYYIPNCINVELLALVFVFTIISGYLCLVCFKVFVIYLPNNCITVNHVVSVTLFVIACRPINKSFVLTLTSSRYTSCILLYHTVCTTYRYIYVIVTCYTLLIRSTFLCVFSYYVQKNVIFNRLSIGQDSLRLGGLFPINPKISWLCL